MDISVNSEIHIQIGERDNEIPKQNIFFVIGSIENFYIIR